MELENEESKIAGDLKQEEKEEDSRKCYEIKRKYVIVSLGVVLLFSGYTSCTTLQTSINVKGGLGSMVSSVNFGSQILVSLLFAPFLLRVLGAKKCLLLSEICYLLFIVANFTQTPAVLLVGAVSAGFGQGLFWVPTGIGFLHFGRLYHRYSSKSIDACVLEMSAILFSLFQFNQVLGNIFVFTILRAFQSPNIQSFTGNTTANNDSSSFTQTDTTTLEDVLNFTTSAPPTDLNNRFTFCGANDCQDPNATQENIDQYVPSNPVALYALMGCFVVLMIMGIIVHIIFVPEIPLAVLNSYNSLSNDKKNGDIEEKYQVSERKRKRSIKDVLAISLQSIKDSIRLFFHPKQMLITPLNVYFGLSLANVYTESTRSFSSCVLGVSQIGICMILFSSFDTIYCFLVGKLSQSCNRTFLILLGFTLEIVIYVFILLWQPSEEFSWLIYLLYCLFGITGGTWQLILANRYSTEFYKNKEVAYSLWNMTFGIGFSLLTAISTSLCMREKMYILFICLFIGVGLYGVLEWTENRKLNRKL